MEAGYGAVDYGVDLTHYADDVDIRTLRMNSVVRDAWIDALESGRFRQGQNRLVSYYANRVEHCCLGVLCELAVDAGIVRRDVAGYVVDFPDGSDARYTSTLPEVVSRWAGLWTDDPVVTTPAGVESSDVRHPLSNCNDLLNMNFSQIAVAIRASL